MIQLVALGALHAADANPLGELEVRGQAHLWSADQAGHIAINNSTYGWFSGDRVATRPGANAILNLDAGASFGLGENSILRVSLDKGIAVALERGVLLYAVEDRAGGMTVVSGDHILTTESNEPRALLVSTEPQWSIGMIQLMEDGSVEVTVREGVLLASNKAGDVRHQVVAGQPVRISENQVRAVQVQVEVTTASTSGMTLAKATAWMAANPLLTAVIVAGAVVGGVQLYNIVFDDDDDDEAPVSP